MSIDVFDDIDENEERAEALIKKYGIIPNLKSRDELKRLLEYEIENYQEGSSEYLRVLCGMLFCIGYVEDSILIWEAKRINFDVGCMIDMDFIFGAGIEETFNFIKGNKELQKMGEFLEGYRQNYDFDKQDIIKNFAEYYTSYFSL